MRNPSHEATVVGGTRYQSGSFFLFNEGGAVIHCLCKFPVLFLKGCCALVSKVYNL